eukprot:403363449
MQQILQFLPSKLISPFYYVLKCDTSPDYLQGLQEENDRKENEFKVQDEEEKQQMHSKYTSKSRDEMETSVELLRANNQPSQKIDSDFQDNSQQQKQNLTTEFDQNLQVQIAKKCRDCNSDLKYCVGTEHSNDQEEPIHCKQCTKLHKEEYLQDSFVQDDNFLEVRCLGFCDQVYQLKKIVPNQTKQANFFCLQCEEKLNKQQCFTCKKIFKFPTKQFSKNVKTKFDKVKMDLNQFKPNCMQCTQKCSQINDEKCKQCSKPIFEVFNFQNFDGLCWACVTPQLFNECLDLLTSYENSLKSKQQIYLFGDINQEEIHAFQDVKKRQKIYQINLMNDYPTLFNWFQNLWDELQIKVCKCQSCKMTYRYNPILQFKTFQSEAFCQQKCLSNYKQKQNPRKPNEIVKNSIITNIQIVQAKGKNKKDRIIKQSLIDPQSAQKPRDFGSFSSQNQNIKIELSNPLQDQMETPIAVNMIQSQQPQEFNYNFGNKQIIHDPQTMNQMRSSQQQFGN